MSFWNNLFGDKKKVKNVSPSKEPIKIEKQPLKENPILSYSRSWNTLKRPSNRSLAYNFPAYDLNDITRLEDVESIIMQAHLKKLALMFKQGWSLIGKNPKTVEYIEQRFQEIDNCIPDHEDGVEELLINTAANLIKVSNAFWVKVRDSRGTKLGKVIKKNGKTYQPVVAYFNIPPETMMYGYDEWGHIIGYKQWMPDGRVIFFDPEDIIHFRYNRKTGITIGTPILIPVKDDIKALREIEENIEILLHQHLFPLFQFIVGTEDSPATALPGGQDEIDYWRERIETLPAEGALVTSERQKIEVIGVQGEAVDASKYLEYFRNRVIGGQGMSGIDFGIADAGNRATVNSMSRALTDNIKFLQISFATQLNRHVIRELLLEGGFKDPLGRENCVEFRFNEIDIDVLLKIQASMNLLYQSGLVTRTEARAAIGLEAMLEEDDDDLMISHALKKGIAPGGNKLLENKTQPTNQHGKKVGSSPPKDSMNDSFEENYDHMYQTIMFKLSSSTNFNEIKAALRIFGTNTKDEFTRVINGYFPWIAGEDIKYKNKLISMMEHDVDHLITFLERQIYNHSKSDSGEIRTILETAKYRARFIDNFISNKAKNLYTALKHKSLGVQKLITVPQIGSEHEEYVIDLAELDIDLIPPSGKNPNCACSIKPLE